MTPRSVESSSLSLNRVKIIDEMAGRPSTRPAIPPLLKQLNERTVLEAIRAGAPISRAQISRRAGISKPTVSLALQSLLEAGLVRAVDHDPGGPSYGAVFFEPVPDAALVLGLDLGARFLRGAICDLGGAVRARQDVELSDVDAAGVLAAVAALQRSLVEAAGVPEEALDGAIVGVPGVVDAHTGLVHMTSVPGLEGMAFGNEAERVLGLPVAVENDINLAALGEHWLGVARGVDDFIFLSVGTGLGAGLVLRGELHRGRHGPRGSSISSPPASRSTSTRAPERYPSSRRSSPNRTGRRFSCHPTIRLPCSQRHARVTRSRVRS